MILAGETDADKTFMADHRSWRLQIRQGAGGKMVEEQACPCWQGGFSQYSIGSDEIFWVPVNGWEKVTLKEATQPVAFWKAIVIDPADLCKANLIFIYQNAINNAISEKLVNDYM